MKFIISIVFLIFLFQCVHMQMPGWYVGTVDNNKHFWTFPSNEHYLAVTDRCSWMHMQLATIDSAEENELIANYLISQGNFSISKKQFWIGGTDLFDEGNWHWYNNYDKMEYTNWYTGSTPPMDYSKNCMLVHPSGLWFDQECSFLPENNYYPLCESYDIAPPQKNHLKQEKKSTSPTVRFEPKNMNNIGMANNKYFWIDADKNTAYTSTQWDFCQSKGLNLVSVESQEEFDLILDYLKRNNMTGHFGTSAVPFHADYLYWMKTGERIVNSSYISVPEPQIGERLPTLCIDPTQSIVTGCSLVGVMTIAICEIDL